ILASSTGEDARLIASTSLSGMVFQVLPDLPSATVTLVIAQEPEEPTPTPVPPSPTPAPTQEPGDPDDPTPAPTWEPVEPTPIATPGATDPADDESGTSPVTSLPSTGSGDDLRTAIALYGALAATVLLVLGGMAIRIRGSRD